MAEAARTLAQARCRQRASPTRAWRRAHDAPVRLKQSGDIIAGLPSRAFRRHRRRRHERHRRGAAALSATRCRVRTSPTSATTRRLAGLGARDRIAATPAENVADADVVVVSSAIKADNPELVAARARAHSGRAARRDARRTDALPARHRRRRHARQDDDDEPDRQRARRRRPRSDVRDRRPACSRPARTRGSGTGEYLVAEADEATARSCCSAGRSRSSRTSTPTIWRTTAATSIACARRSPNSCIGCRSMASRCCASTIRKSPRSPRRRRGASLTYGIGDDADVRASEFAQEGERTHFTLHLPDGGPSLPIALNLPGRAQRAQRAGGVRRSAGSSASPPEAIAARARKIPGRRPALPVARRDRRSTTARRMLVDDYGHHPRELAAVFAAARDGWPSRRLVVAFQPHRYTRTRDLLDDFAQRAVGSRRARADRVYPAGEAPIAGADGRALARAVRARGKVDPVLIEHPRELRGALPPLLRDGDLLLLLGAGDIGAAANEIADGRHREVGGMSRSPIARRVRTRRGASWAAIRPSAKYRSIPAAMCSRRCAREASMRMRSTAFRRCSMRCAPATSRACSTSCTARGGEKTACCRARSNRCGVPYTGSGVLGSALIMDKMRTKQVWAAHRSADAATTCRSRAATTCVPRRRRSACR